MVKSECPSTYRIIWTLLDFSTNNQEFTALGIFLCLLKVYAAINNIWRLDSISTDYEIR